MVQRPHILAGLPDDIQDKKWAATTLVSQACATTSTMALQHRQEDGPDGRLETGRAFQNPPPPDNGAGGGGALCLRRRPAARSRRSASPAPTLLMASSRRNSASRCRAARKTHGSWARAHFADRTPRNSECRPNTRWCITMRVFMCTVGTCGFQGCAISEMPLAQNRGSSSPPGICLRNSGENSPCTVEQCKPTFSNTRPDIIDITPPPPAPLSRCQGVRLKCPAGFDLSGPSSSRCSSAMQILSRRLSNHVVAAHFLSWMSSGKPAGCLGAAP